MSPSPKSLEHSGRGAEIEEQEDGEEHYEVLSSGYDMTIIITNSENVAFFPRHKHMHTHNWGRRGASCVEVSQEGW